MKKVIDIADVIKPSIVDITGGAPELNPNLMKFIEKLRKRNHQVQIRTNLTILCESSMRKLPRFFLDNNVKLVGSLPCYLKENVNIQRGEKSFEKSIEALQMLNNIGYGVKPNLELNLVHNPVGFNLPTEQTFLEEEYRRELGRLFNVKLTGLLTIINMPIGRFLKQLEKQNQKHEYMKLLKESFNPNTLDGLMCRHQISVDWDGDLFDCDFNLALGLTVDHGAPSNIKDFDVDILSKRRIVTGDHCFGCTAGFGSSCRGSLA
jgi:radical SAM/Cys-rich protein